MLLPSSPDGVNVMLLQGPDHSTLLTLCKPLTLEQQPHCGCCIHLTTSTPGSWASSQEGCPWSWLHWLEKNRLTGLSSICHWTTQQPSPSLRISTVLASSEDLCNLCQHQHQLTELNRDYTAAPSPQARTTTFHTVGALSPDVRGVSFPTENKP